MRRQVRMALATILVLLGGTAARADILFFDDLDSQINVYYTTHATLNLSTDLIYTVPSETVQISPGVPISNLSLPNGVNILDASGAVSDTLQFLTTLTKSGVLVSINFTSAAPGTNLSPIRGVNMYETGQIQDVGIASGTYSGSAYSVDVQFRTKADTAVPEPAPWMLIAGAVPVLALFQRARLA